MKNNETGDFSMMKRSRYELKILSIIIKRHDVKHDDELRAVAETFFFFPSLIFCIRLMYTCIPAQLNKVRHYPDDEEKCRKLHDWRRRNQLKR